MRPSLGTRVIPFKSQLKCMCTWELRFQSQRAWARILPQRLHAVSFQPTLNLFVATAPSAKCLWIKCMRGKLRAVPGAQ